MSACTSCPPAAAGVPVATDAERPGVGEVIGRDPAGTQWRVRRYAEDWAASALHDVVFSATRGVLELRAHLPDRLRVDADGRPLQARLATETLVTPSGDAYRSKPSTGQVLRRAKGDSAFLPLEGFGGLGSALGQSRQPAGLGWHPQGHLLLADSGNHRVQVLRPSDGSVVLALGRRDAWGAPLEAREGGGMTEPVDVAVDPCSCAVFVADRRGGQVHVFDGRYRYQRSFEPRPEGAPDFSPAPIALAVLDDGSVAVADPGWPRVLIFDASGTLQDERGLHEVMHPRFEGLRLASAFAREGEVLIGPIDSGLYDVAWHELRLELSCPAGTQVLLQSWATNDASAGVADAAWAPAEAVPILQGETRPSRLIQADWGAWETWRAGDQLDPPPKGTDRGRYLFVRMRLLGRLARPSDSRALATPSVSAVYARFPRPSLLKHLPGRWSRRDDVRDPAGALFVERYLAMFERVLTDMEVQIEDLPRLMNPRTAPGPWLDWIASWLNLAFDPSWELDRRRALLREAVSLYRMRGTPKGLARYVEIYTGLPPSIVEGFSTRPMGQALTLNEGSLGTLPLGPQEAVDPDRGAHTFEIFATLARPEDLEVSRAVVRSIVESQKPAHADYTLHMVLPDARVGCQSTVGVDLILGHGVASPAPICADPSQGATQPVLGSSVQLGQIAPSSSPSSPTLDQAGVVVDDSFLLT